jgi:glycosyltransferase involved in cell wall biosynthesis
MKFGIVTPTLDAERYFEHTLSSIWRQANDRIHIDHVIVDGGSRDRTLELAARYPSRTLVGRDGGMYEAINRGVAEVTGDVLGYINADDEVAPNALDRVADAFEAHPEVQWLCGRVEYIDGTGKVLTRMTPVKVTLNSYLGIGWSCIPQQTVWARRSFCERVGVFDTSFSNCGDYDWYARALNLAQPLILPQTLGRFRWHEDNLSYDDAAMVRESRQVQNRWGGPNALRSLQGQTLRIRLNLRNPGWLLAKKSGRLTFAR